MKSIFNGGIVKVWKERLEVDMSTWTPSRHPGVSANTQHRALWNTFNCELAHLHPQPSCELFLPNSVHCCTSESSQLERQHTFTSSHPLPYHHSTMGLSNA